jgi:hypothetical protein
VTEIKRFNHYTECPKCGGLDFARVYCGPSKRYRYFDGAYCEAEELPEEHFHRWCRECKYGWIEELPEWKR